MAFPKKPVIVNGETHWTCSVCGETKHESNFSKANSSACPVRPSCKVCCKEYRDEYKRNNLMEVRRRDRLAKRGKPKAPSGVPVSARRRQWRESGRRRKPQIAAKNAVRYAISTGLLVRPDRCEMCDKDRFTEAHHDSYEKARRLVVVWFCKHCHEWTHLKRREQRDGIA